MNDMIYKPLEEYSDEIRHYWPEGMYFWDSWYLPHEGKVHVFHLQVKRPGSTRLDEDNCSIGHAVSDDLLHWTELPVALRKGPEGSYDCGPLFTGCTVWHQGTYYLFYTGNGHPPWVETICLATSKDGINFTKYPGNPIIKADGTMWKVEDVRDIIIRPDGNGWMGIVVMRLKDKDLYDSICWVLYRSKDLIHWEMYRIVFAMPGRFNIFEVPDFFPLGDKWYVIAHNGDGSGSWSDPGIYMGTIVGEADSPEGPFVEVKDNLLHKSNDYQGFSARTLEWNDERLMIYGRNEGIGNSVVFGRMSWPIKLVPRPGGGLLPMYWHGCDRAFKASQKFESITLRSEKGQYIHDLGIHTVDRSFMAVAMIELGSAKSAGLAFSWIGLSEHDGPPSFALLDSEVGAVVVTYPTSQQKIQWHIKPGGSYRIRLIVVQEMVELYVDEELVINCFMGVLTDGGIGLFVADGEATFSEIEYWS